MIKKKLVKRRTVSERTDTAADNSKRVLSTQWVKEQFDKNPDTSVYSKRYLYKHNTSQEDAE